MKKISLNKASKLYDEIKECKLFGDFVRIYIHDDEVKIGYSNELGKSDFIRNNEPRILIMNEDKLDELLQDYWKKDAVKIIQEWVNEVIEDKDTMEKLKYLEKWHKIGLR